MFFFLFFYLLLGTVQLRFPPALLGSLAGRAAASKACLGRLLLAAVALAWHSATQQPWAMHCARDKHAWAIASQDASPDATARHTPLLWSFSVACLQDSKHKAPVLSENWGLADSHTSLVQRSTSMRAAPEKLLHALWVL